MVSASSFSIFRIILTDVIEFGLCFQKNSISDAVPIKGIPGWQPAEN
jgi:hypothetical protein